MKPHCQFPGLFELAGIGGSRTACLDLMGVEAFHAFDVDEVEAARRDGLGLGAIVDLRVLRALCSLPSDAPVPLDNLREQERRLMTDLPPGIADLTKGGVVRRLHPVVMPRGVIVVDDDWDRGLDRASRFAAFCPRLLLTSSGPHAERAQVEAAYYGIGLALTVPGKAPELAVAPEPARGRFGPVSWQYREQIYAELAGE